VDGGTYHGVAKPVNGDILRVMDMPDYLMCLECGTPCYVYEWEGDHLVEAVCTACGNEELTLFVTPEEYEEQTSEG
jgi:hypothetical protein